MVIPHIDIRTQNDQQESYWFSARWPCQHQHVVSSLLEQNTNGTCVCVKEEEMVQKDKREERERVQLNGNCNDPTHLLPSHIKISSCLNTDKNENFAVEIKKMDRRLGH